MPHTRPFHLPLCGSAPGTCGLAPRDTNAVGRGLRVVFKGCRHRTERGGQGVSGAGSLLVGIPPPGAVPGRAVTAAVTLAAPGSSLAAPGFSSPSAASHLLVIHGRGQEAPPRPPFNVGTITIAPEG